MTEVKVGDKIFVQKMSSSEKFGEPVSYCVGLHHWSSQRVQARSRARFMRPHQTLNRTYHYLAHFWWGSKVPLQLEIISRKNGHPSAQIPSQQANEAQFPRKITKAHRSNRNEVMAAEVPLNYEASAGATHLQVADCLPSEVVQCLQNARFVRPAISSTLICKSDLYFTS